MLNDYINFFNALELLLFVIDTNGIIIFCNNTACNRLGYSKEELIGMPVINIHPSEQRMFAQLLIQDMLNGTIDACPIPVQCKDGKLIQVETRVSVGVWQGQEALFGVTKDITLLKLSNEKFITIFRFCPIPIAITGVEDGKIYDVNDAWCKFTGFTTEEAVGNTIYDLQLYKSKEDREALLSKLEKDGMLDNYHVVMQVKGGKLVIGQFSASPITINGKDCWITAMVDRTSQAKLEEAILIFKNTVQGNL